MPPMAPTAPLQDVLARAESCSERLSQALLAGEADAVAVASSEMQQMAQQLSDRLQRAAQRATLDASMAARLRRLGQDLAQQRAACLRHGAVVERSLASLLPASRSATYAVGSTPYGAQARRSGAFKLISA